MRKGVSGAAEHPAPEVVQGARSRAALERASGDFPGAGPRNTSASPSSCPELRHLPAPGGFGPIRLDRFSPNFFDARTLGFKDVRPLPSYRHVYPGLADEALANLAYFFGFGYQEARDVDAYVAPLVRALRSWTQAARRGDTDLFSVDLGDRLLVWDLRLDAPRPLVVLTGEERVLYQACDVASDARGLELSWRSRDPSGPKAAEIVARLNALVHLGLMAVEGPRYLALAIPLGEYQPPRKVVERFWKVARSLGGALPSWKQRPTALAAGDFSLDAAGDLRIADVVRVASLTIGDADEQESRREVRRGQEKEEEAERVHGR